MNANQNSNTAVYSLSHGPKRFEWWYPIIQTPGVGSIGARIVKSQLDRYVYIPGISRHTVRRGPSSTRRQKMLSSCSTAMFCRALRVPRGGREGGKWMSTAGGTCTWRNDSLSASNEWLKADWSRLICSVQPNDCDQRLFIQAALSKRSLTKNCSLVEMNVERWTLACSITLSTCNKRRFEPPSRRKERVASAYVIRDPV
jgi:hypothetical protein